MLFRALLILLALIIQAIAQNTLNFVTSKNVGELNPHLYSPNEMFAQDMLYEGLFKYDENGTISPLLATNYRIENDGKRYIFTLRDDVYFTDGVKFDAIAVKANFDAIIENRKRHSWLELANIIQSVEILDDKTIALNILKPYEPTPKELSLIRPFRFISPNSLINGSSKDGIKAPVGTGKFKLESSVAGVSDTFIKNEKYWGEAAKIDKIVSKVIPYPSTKILALKTKQADLIYSSEQIPLDAIESLKSEFNVEISAPINTLVIAINSNKFPTNSLSVRKALNMAVDKDALVKSVFFNTQKKADFLFSTTLKNCDVDLKPYEFNTKMANEILEQDGYKMTKDGIREKNGQKLEMNLVYIGTDAIKKSIGEILQNDFKKIGVKLSLKADESSIFYKKQQSGDFHLIFNETWGVPYDPEIFLGSMRTISHADYQAQLGLKQKAELDANITKILDGSQDSAKLIKSALKTLHNEAIYIPISFETNIAISSKNLDGVNAKAISNHVPFDKMFKR
ncbi:nickel ABC transporter substrate-binding protein [Campylobacter mucosalis]|uniref:nickel ABC transporter substrate-binding protein n=1 Tax=Campylobacter mucosalis TaxID=202 RepID=UPI0014707D59|nr:nickel ABC transporter substrate-binding protein [Campylobacter mucosalis]